MATDTGAEPQEPTGANESESFASALEGVAPLPPRPAVAPRARPRLGGPSESERDAKPPRTFDFPEPDEPLLAIESGADPRLLSRLAGRQPAPELHIDLHGMQAEPAERMLSRSLASAHTARLRCILVVHGRGANSPAGPVLKEAMPGWLTGGRNSRYVRAFAPAQPRDGGAGATYVLLR